MIKEIDVGVISLEYDDLETIEAYPFLESVTEDQQ